MRREERVTVQGPVKQQQPDGLSHRGCIPFGDDFVFQFGANTFPTTLLRAIQGTRSLCSPSGGGRRVLGRCCRPAARSSCALGSEKLVVVENICELGPRAKKAAVFDSWGAGGLKSPVFNGSAPKKKRIGGVLQFSPHEDFRRRNCPQTTPPIYPLPHTPYLLLETSVVSGSCCCSRSIIATPRWPHCMPPPPCPRRRGTFCAGLVCAAEQQGKEH